MEKEEYIDSELPDLIGRICLCPLCFLTLNIFKPSFSWGKSSYCQKEDNERKEIMRVVSQAHLMAVCTCTVGTHRSGKGPRSSSYFDGLCMNEPGRLGLWVGLPGVLHKTYPLEIFWQAVKEILVWCDEVQRIRKSGELPMIKQGLIVGRVKKGRLWSM